mmetsp:Transcript_14135/g.20271  ORF Transcript_14135/g.20271 Transcript_14135/m.20271 type:complete len:352 (+) Transcript_14135:63-1118(+)
MRFSKLAIAVLGVALSWLGALVYRERYMLLMIKRLSANPFMDPKITIRTLQGLAQIIPKNRTIILAIPAKSGTTWVGHIAHQILVHGAAVDGKQSLHEDSVYPEFAPFLFDGLNLHELDPPYWEREPFKSYPNGPITIRSHISYSQLDQINATENDGFRLLTVLREPKELVVSGWRFVPPIVGIDYDLISLETYYRFTKMMGLIEETIHLYADWWEHRHSPNVLLLFFDDLKSDLDGSVRRIADFFKSNLTEEELLLVIQQSSHSFMTHPDVIGRFNDLHPKISRGFQGNITRWESKVTVVQKHASSKALPDFVRNDLDRMWAKIVLPRTGCSNYQEMRSQFAAERKALLR